MVTKSAAKTTLDPKMFDFSTLMAQSKPPQPQAVSVFLRADLIERIKELSVQLNVDPDDDQDEKAIGDPASADTIGAEYDDLVEQFNASEVQFMFRGRKLSDVTNARAAMAADNVDLTSDESGDISISYMLAQTCENATMTGAEWHLWREKIGETAFQPLVEAMVQANTGVGVTAPFSRRPSPGLTSEK